ncbi:acyl-CoA thioesterase/BAAT N-terminal domain-containing protein, partial [Bordetella avium]|uniref:acyl-CoA thioesterase/BAAT N-terminal domain-containing protein n=1 Tax=Bordetella avium TaxID=521 RepID=UPI0039FD40AE
MSVLTLTIEPADALIDAPRRIVVDGALPGAEVTLATATSRAGVIWRAAARFVADAQGRVDLGRDAPLSGSYDGVALMGLIWSQAPDVAGRREAFNQPVTEALVTEVTAASGETQARS